tara:strand:- start:500 stop:1150 length:651 start_codon:yes stop_codon:yes gene_type:complete
MNEERIEKKFIFGKYKEDYLEKILLLNGFSRSYPSRNISSIYLDTLNFDYARDNINGVSKRKKIRFRWYNNDHSNIFLEEKNKQNFLIRKKIKKIDKLSSNGNFIGNLKHYFFNKVKKYNSFNYKFVLKTNYLRSYWISDNKKIRATIDINLKTSPIYDLNFNLDLNETILEFKFLPSEEFNFRELIFKNNLNVRTKKYSKYLQSFYLLEDSGLIN